MNLTVQSIFLCMLLFVRTRAFKPSSAVQPTKANSGRSKVFLRSVTGVEGVPESIKGETSVEKRILGVTNVVLYDGVCNFCNAWVDLLLQVDTGGIFSFAPLQGEAGMALLEKVGRERSDISSVVLVKKNGTKGMYEGYVKSDAVVEVMKELNLPLLSMAGVGLAAILPKALKNGLYDQVANNRYRLMGTRTTMERLSDEVNAHRFLW